ncbi:hypothetical protein [Rhizobacter sp. OV335]|uniref:hypothetical protein n=1 Tax=Rhizobacter sp. OV335 TaxID=1500264 RepID=UPI000921FD49|nr:hypothetical protein [Rhizobacter sp. OV335]SHN40531.1 hypothetical protein SAMN02787076_06272 [Rhizobacter sp. OV335]
MRHLITAAIALLSWTLPRVGPLKLTEAIALLGAPKALASRSVQTLMIRCYWPFFIASIVALAMAGLNLSVNPETNLTSEKALYSTPGMVALITFIRILAYLITVSVLVHFFQRSTQQEVSRTLRIAYYTTILPGALQLLRLHTGLYFDLPFERPDAGPFSGIFASSNDQMRLMGFEIEPLAYASSLVTACCLSMHNGRRIPWLGMVVLYSTYGVGAIIGLCLALLLSISGSLRRWIIPLYAAGVAGAAWFIVANIDDLLDQFQLIGSVAERLGSIYNCVAIWLDHPLGGGLGTYGYWMNGYDRTGTFLTNRIDFHANNDSLEFLAAGGLLLAGGHLYAFHVVLKRSRSYWLWVACTALMIQSISAYIFFNPALMVVFAMLLARLEPVPKAAKPARRRRGVRFVWPRLPRFRWDMRLGRDVPPR